MKWGATGLLSATTDAALYPSRPSSLSSFFNFTFVLFRHLTFGVNAFRHASYPLSLTFAI
jgi:hypothetical protein